MTTRCGLNCYLDIYLVSDYCLIRMWWDLLVSSWREVSHASHLLYPHFVISFPSLPFHLIFPLKFVWLVMTSSRLEPATVEDDMEVRETFEKGDL